MRRSTGMYATFEEAVAAMVHKANLQPDHTTRIYTQLFNDVYKKSFHTLDPYIAGSPRSRDTAEE